MMYLGTSYVTLANGSSRAKAELPARVVGRSGSLVICGGGRMPDRVRAEFLELAGGSHARIVVIPTAHASADWLEPSRVLEPWKDQALDSIQILHTRTRTKADDPEFVRPLTDATGVWFSGGRQQSVTDAYLGTEVERQLMALLARGGVIGGNSAGAAVMSLVMITSGRTEATLGKGFDFLPGAVIDQHFLKRNRIKRLLGVVRDHPDLVGLGIDEQTALVVDVKEKRLRVIGNSYVVACVPDLPPLLPAGASEAGSAHTTSTHLEILKPGDEADLAALRNASSGAVVSAIDLDAL
jgi:cyanophycinase